MFSYKKLMPENLFQMDFSTLDNYSVVFDLNYYLENMLNSRNIPQFCSYLEKNDVPICNKLIDSTEILLGEAVGYKLSKKLKSTEMIEKKCMGFQMCSLCVSYQSRRCGIASILIDLFFKTENDFIKLFVRRSNSAAINIYKKKGFVVRRIVNRYYHRPDEDALELIKTKGFEICVESDISTWEVSDTVEND